MYGCFPTLKTIHPCQFPVELVERLVLSMTNECDRVLDPYMGVGYSVVVALKCGREGYGCDIVKDYVDVAWERVNRLELVNYKRGLWVNLFMTQRKNYARKEALCPH